MLVALFDHLQIKPIFSGLRMHRWTPAPRILGNLPINSHYGIVDTSPAIGDQRRWRFWMTTLLQSLKDLQTGFRFILADPVSHT